jgi:hypothetical protein
VQLAHLLSSSLSPWDSAICALLDADDPEPTSGSAEQSTESESEEQQAGSHGAAAAEARALLQEQHPDLVDAIIQCHPQGCDARAPLARTVARLPLCGRSAAVRCRARVCSGCVEVDASNVRTACTVTDALRHVPEVTEVVLGSAAVAPVATLVDAVPQIVTQLAAAPGLRTLRVRVWWPAAVAQLLMRADMTDALRKLRCLDVSSVELGDSTIAALAEATCGFPELTSLDLAETGMGVGAASVLAQHVNRLTGLQVRSA